MMASSSRHRSIAECSFRPMQRKCICMLESSREPPFKGVNATCIARHFAVLSGLHATCCIDSLSLLFSFMLWQLGAMTQKREARILLCDALWPLWASAMRLLPQVIRDLPFRRWPFALQLLVPRPSTCTFHLVTVVPPYDSLSTPTANN